MALLRFLFSRVLVTLPVLVIVALLTFSMISITPGDPAALAAGESATPEMIEETRERLGLNEPTHVRFARWSSGAIRGDLGESLFSGQSVTAVILDRLPVTFALTGAAIVVGLVIALPAGLFAARRPGSVLDRSTVLVTSLGISAPDFFVALLLIGLFALQLEWLPATGYAPLSEGLVAWSRSILLPATALGVGVAAELTRHVRGAMADVLEQDYVRTAYAKGLSSPSIMVKHALRNAALPVVTVLGLQIRRLLGGTVIVESIFAINGVGSLAVRAVFHRDFPMLMGVALVTGLTVLVVNLLVDMSYGYLNPKVRVN